MKKLFRNFAKNKKATNLESQSISSKLSDKSHSTPSLTNVGAGYSVDIDTTDRSFTKLHKACWLGNLDKVKKHTKKNDINLKDNNNRAPLHLAAAQGHSDVVSFLLYLKADANIQDGENMTPLIKAVENHHGEVVDILLQQGADINICDSRGNTALLLALMNGQNDVAFALLSFNADVNIANQEGLSPLHIAVEKKMLGVTKKLLELGASVNAADSYGRTPLMMASQVGFLPLVELILEHGGNVELHSKSNMTAEDIAKEAGHSTVVQALRGHRHSANRDLANPIPANVDPADVPKETDDDKDSWDSDDSVVQEKPPAIPNLQLVTRLKQESLESLEKNTDVATDSMISTMKQHMLQRKKTAPQDEILSELGLSDGSDISSVKFDESEDSLSDSKQRQRRTPSTAFDDDLGNVEGFAELSNVPNVKNDDVVPAAKNVGLSSSELKPKDKTEPVNRPTKQRLANDDDSYLNFSSDEEEFVPSYVPSSLAQASSDTRNRTFSFDSNSANSSVDSKVTQHQRSTPKTTKDAIKMSDNKEEADLDSNQNNLALVNEKIFSKHESTDRKDSSVIDENLLVNISSIKTPAEVDVDSIDSWPSSSSSNKSEGQPNKQLRNVVQNVDVPKDYLKPESRDIKGSSASSTGTLSGTLGKLGTLKSVEEIVESNAVLMADELETKREHEISPKPPSSTLELPSMNPDISGLDAEKLKSSLKDETSATVSDVIDGMGQRRGSSDTLHSVDIQDELENTSVSFDEVELKNKTSMEVTLNLVSSPSKIGEIQALVREYCLALDKEKGENKALKSRIKALSKENSLLQRKVQEITSAKYEIDQALLSAENSKTELRYKAELETEKVNNAEYLLKSLQDQLNAKEELYKSELSTKENQEKVLKSLEEQVESAHKMIQDLKSKISILEDEITRKDKALQENENTYQNKLQMSEETCIKTKQNLEHKIIQLEEQEKQLQNENRKLNDQLSNIKEDRSKQIDFLEEKIRFLTEVKEENVARLDEAQRNGEAKQQALQDASLKFASEIKELHLELDKMQKRLLAEQALKADLEKEMATLKENFAELERNKTERQQELYHLQQCLDAKEEELQSYKASKQSEIDTLACKNQALDLKLSAMEKELNSARVQLIKEKQTAEDSLNELNTELKDTKELLQDKSNYLLSLESELEQVNELKKKAVFQLGKVKEENIILTQRLEALQNEFKICEKEKKGQSEELQALKSEVKILAPLKDSAQLWDRLKADHEQAFAALEEKYRQISKENERLKREAAEHQFQLGAAEKRRKSVEKSLSASEKEITALKTALKSKSTLEKEHQMLKSETAEIMEHLQLKDAQSQMESQQRATHLTNVSKFASQSSGLCAVSNARIEERFPVMTKNNEEKLPQNLIVSELERKSSENILEQLHKTESAFRELSDHIKSHTNAQCEPSEISSKVDVGHCAASLQNVLNQNSVVQDINPSEPEKLQQRENMKHLMQEVTELKSYLNETINKIKEFLERVHLGTNAFHNVDQRSEMYCMEQKLLSLQLQVQDLAERLGEKQPKWETDTHTLQSELLTLQKWQKELITKVEKEFRKLAMIQQRQSMWNHSHEHAIQHEIETIATQELSSIMEEFRRQLEQSALPVQKPFVHPEISDSLKQLEFVRTKQQLTQELLQLKLQVEDNFRSKQQTKSFPSLEKHSKNWFTPIRPALPNSRPVSHIITSSPVHSVLRVQSNPLERLLKWSPSPLATNKAPVFTYGASQENDHMPFDNGNFQNMRKNTNS